MSTKTAFATLIVAAIIVVGFIILRGPAEAPGTPASQEPESTAVPAPSEENVPEMIVAQVVSYDDQGYSPSTITIKAGDKVTWQNESTQTMWTASAVHPTHKVYPGSDIQLCGTSQAAGIFDSCRGIAPGEEWSFTFNERGTWRYHNHRQASHTGTVVVE